MNRILSSKKAIGVFMIPGAVVYLFVVMIPVVWSIVYSFFEGAPGISFKFRGISGYLQLFTDRQFRSSLIITLKYCLTVTAFQMILGLGLAFLFTYGIKRCKTLARTITFLPVVLPIVAVGQLFSKIYDIAPTYGLINSLLDMLGLEQYIQAWIGLPSTALGALCVQDVWMTMGFYAIILYAGLVDVPANLLEAGKIDGARGFTLARYITLPLMRPVIGTALIYSLSSTLKVFSSVLALTAGGPAKSTYTLSLYMYDTAFNFNKYGYGSVIGVFIMLECIIIVAVVNRIINKKEQ